MILLYVWLANTLTKVQLEKTYTEFIPQHNIIRVVYHISLRFFRVFELRQAEVLEFFCLFSIFIIYAVFAMFFSFILVRQNHIFFIKVYKVRVVWLFLFKYIHCIVYNAIKNTNWNCCWFYLYVRLLSIFYLFLFFLQCDFCCLCISLEVKSLMAFNGSLLWGNSMIYLACAFKIKYICLISLNCHKNWLFISSFGA